jgi:hypothetical protein
MQADQHDDYEEVRPNFPDEAFEVSLASYLSECYPSNPHKPELEDIARSSFYEAFAPRETWRELSPGVILAVMDFAEDALKSRGSCCFPCTDLRADDSMITA